MGKKTDTLKAKAIFRQHSKISRWYRSGRWHHSVPSVLPFQMLEMGQIWMMTQFCTICSAFEKDRNGTDLEDDMFLYPFPALKRYPGRDRINGIFKSVPFRDNQTSKLMVQNQAAVSICPISKRSGKEKHGTETKNPPDLSLLLAWPMSETQPYFSRIAASACPDIASNKKSSGSPQWISGCKF